MPKSNTPFRSTFLNQEAASAWNYFIDKGYPTSNDENWRYSSPRKWINNNIKNITLKNELNKKDFTQYLIPGCINILIGNDRLVQSEKIPNYIQVGEFISDTDNKNYYPYISKMCNYKTSPFNAENTALFQNLITMNIKKEYQNQKPLHIIHLIQNPTSVKIFPRIYINIEKTSNINIWKTEISNDDNNYYINQITEINTCQNSNVKWYNIQKQNYYSTSISSFNITCERNTSFQYNSFDYGGKFIRHDINSYLVSKGSNYEINSLFAPNKSQHVDIASKVYHQAPFCSSNQLIKGVLSENSSAVFRGLAHVNKKAIKTDAQQTNNNIILSPNAQMNSIPQLEIFEEDVKCTHGSTTGKINEDALFYLQSRGISHAKAMEIMIHGFVNEIIEKIEHENIRNDFYHLLNNKWKS